MTETINLRECVYNGQVRKLFLRHFYRTGSPHPLPSGVLQESKFKAPLHWLNFSDLHVMSMFYTIYRLKTKVGFLLVFVVLTPFETMSWIYLTANMTFCVMQMFMRQFVQL